MLQNADVENRPKESEYKKCLSENARKLPKNFLEHGKCVLGSLCMLIMLAFKDQETAEAFWDIFKSVYDLPELVNEVCIRKNSGYKIERVKGLVRKEAISSSEVFP